MPPGFPRRLPATAECSVLKYNKIFFFVFLVSIMRLGGTDSICLAWVSWCANGTFNSCLPGFCEARFICLALRVAFFSLSFSRFPCSCVCVSVFGN